VPATCRELCTPPAHHELRWEEFSFLRGIDRVVLGDFSYWQEPSADVEKENPNALGT
jgi:hypothetical protein